MFSQEEMQLDMYRCTLDGRPSGSDMNGQRFLRYLEQLCSEVQGNSHPPGDKGHDEKH